MAEQVGPQGRVVATDINPRFLMDVDLPNVEVRQHDIRTDALETGAFDVAHCRALLMHLPEPLLVVRRIKTALQIGGWLLVEEPDNSSLRAVDSAHQSAEFFNRKTREVYERVERSSTSNPFFGCQVRGLLEEAGLTEIGNEGRTRIWRGGEPDAAMRCLSLQAYMERGFLSQTEFAELQKVYSDPSFCYVSLTAFAAWGKRAD
jgi:SAM-dependent methyltransferase